MKISDLKQPYRRMAEYLAEINTNENYNDKTILYDAFDWGLTDDLFWDEIFYNGNHPEITPEIKKHFPADFDFSGEVEDEKRYNFAFKNNMEEKYTQLAKEGKFDDLPDTCEFSDAVELEVWDNKLQVKKTVNIVGKFKSKFIEEKKTCIVGYVLWNFAQLPTKKIDFSEFKIGDVVEVETNIEIKLAYFCQIDNNLICLSSNKKLNHSEYKISINDIKSITKIK